MRSYLPTATSFDDGSQVEGIAWSPLRSRFVAGALAGNPTSYLGNVNGQTSYCYSSDGITWTGGISANVPNPPAEVADVYWSDGYTRFFTADSWDPAWWGVQPDGESNSLQGQNTWSKLAKGTTATRSTAICVIEAGTGAANAIVGGALDSGTGRLIGKTTGSSTGPWTAISTPIDNQFFRVAQVAAHPTTGFLVAALTPIGAVTSTERIMTSSDGGLTWAMRSAGVLIDSLNAYGVCWNATLSQWLVTGDQAFATSPDGITWTGHAAAGVATSGKPCAALAVTIIPGGTNGQVSEWDGASLGTQTVSALAGLALKVAAYSSALDRVILGGLGGIAAIYYSATPIAAVVPSLEARFDLG